MLYLDLAAKLLADTETRTMLFAADEFRRIVSSEQSRVALLQNHQSTPTIVFRQSLAFYDRLPPTSPFLVGCVCAALSQCASIAAAVEIYDHLWRALLQETRYPTRPRPYVPPNDPVVAANANAAATVARPSSSSSMRGTVTTQQQQQQQQQQQHNRQTHGTQERRQSQSQPQAQLQNNPTTTYQHASTFNHDQKSPKTTPSSSLSPVSGLRQQHKSGRGLGLGLGQGQKFSGRGEEDEDLRVDIADDDGESGDEDGNHYIDHLLRLPDFHRPIQGTVITIIIIIIIVIKP